MAEHPTDSGHLYIRDTIFLNQALVDEIVKRPKTFSTSLTFVARQIILDGAVINDADVTLVADSITSGTANVVPITLRNTGTAKDGVLTQTGQVEPPVEVLGDPPLQGAPGHTLTVLCRTLIDGGAESHGQQGGKGLRGKFENRAACEMDPIPPSPCEGLTLPELKLVVGSPGGKGLQGGPGGGPGQIVVQCLQNLSGTTGGWVGVGGPGGFGGQGGRGGPNGFGGLLGPGNVILRGPDGPRGDKGDQSDPVTHPVQVLTEAQWNAALAEITVPFRVGPATFEHRPVGPMWAAFRRRQAAEALRRRSFGEAAGHLTAADRIAAPEPGDAILAQQVRDFLTQFAVERDLDVPADVPRFAQDMDNTPLHMRTLLEGALGLLPISHSLLREPNMIRALDADVRDIIAGWLSDGEPDQHTNKAVERANLAGQSRKDAHGARVAARTRLDKLLSDDDHVGVTIAVPGLAAPLAVPALAALTSALFELAPVITEVPGSDPVPSGDAAILLPAQVDLLVNQVTRTGGANGVYPAAVPALVAVAMDVKHQVTDGTAWKAVRVPNTTGAAVNLRQVAAQLRGALRPGGVPLTDPVRLDIVNGLIELSEATHAWRLADLRLEQARLAKQLVATTTAEARAARDLPLAAVGTPAPDVMPTFLRRARVLSGLMEWRWHRLERAFDLYTLNVGPTPIDRTAHAALFDPVFAADLSIAPTGARTELDAAHAASQIVIALDRMAHAEVLPAHAAYQNRGERTFTSDTVPPYPARRTFCLTADGSDCTVAAPHVFAALRDPEIGSTWLDVDLSDVQGPHREAKVRGAFVRVTYDLALGTPGQAYQVELRHSGLSRQRQLENAAEHRLTGLPLPMSFPLRRAVVDGVPQSYWEGQISVNPPVAPGTPTPDPRAVLPAYGRGVAAGYRLFLADWNLAAPDAMTRLEVHIHYEARKPPGSPSVQTVALASTLRVGASGSARVELDGPAPAGGTLVKLRSSDPTTVSMPAQALVPAGQRVATVPVTVLKPTGPVPPTLSASTPDGVSRQGLAPVAAAAPIVPTTTVLGSATEEATAYAVAVGRMSMGAGGPRPAATVFASRTPLMFSEEPADRSDYALHALRGDLGPITQRQIGFWPRAIALDEQRGRLYVLHGDTLSLLDPKTLATKATQLIGINATSVAVDRQAELVYVTRYSHGTIHVLRGSDLSVVQVFGDKPTLRGCQGIAVHPNGGRVYVARNFRIAEPTATAVTSIVRRGDGSHVIDRDTHFPEVALQPHAIAVDGKAGLVFVSCQGGGLGVHPAVLTLDAMTLELVSSVAVPGPGLSVAARQGTGIAYAATVAGLALVDGRAGAVALTVKAGTHSLGVAVDEVTGVAYLTDRVDHTVTRIDTPASVSVSAWR